MKRRIVLKLISVKLTEITSGIEVSTVDKWALIEGLSLGKHDYSLEESEVDELLGSDAFCGGDLSEKHIEKLEDYAVQTMPKYYWNDDQRELVQQFTSRLDEEKILYKIEEVADEDWNKTWRESFSEIKITDDFSVLPSWLKKGDDDCHVFIYPGMGFGTGNHETTFLCLSLYLELEGQLKSPFRCLDFGCGSGILGIAPMKHQSADVTFVDIDVHALDNCVMNLEINHHEKYDCAKDVVLRSRFSLEGKTYDLVFANILEHVLISEKNILLDSLAEGSYLIVSGLLEEQVDGIIHEYGLTHVKTLTKNGWAAVLLRK